MKAFLLAAGFGTRLRPLTDQMPKCLVPIQGRPLLEWWLMLLKRHSVTEVLINTHYLSEQVRAYITQYNAQNTGLTLIEFYEPTLLGSGSTVLANRDFVRNEQEFLICYADNLTNIDLTALLAAHRSGGQVLTMALFRAAHPEQCGIASLDESGKIISFVEKPDLPESNLANAGIYVAAPAVFDFFPQKGFLDFGKDVLPGLTGRMAGWETQDYLLDIGTPENYEKAQWEWNG
ncbi:MAG: nucleotidyltransferase family protein [Oscillospiraceae bacterium]|nr:nucleotidyltransferase family protein [Oscillospiraceae bacterium]